MCIILKCLFHFSVHPLFQTHFAVIKYLVIHQRKLEVNVELLICFHIVSVTDITRFEVLVALPAIRFN